MNRLAMLAEISAHAALGVLMQDPQTREWLIEHDPKALEQADKAFAENLENLAVGLLRTAQESGQLRGTMIGERIEGFLRDVGDELGQRTFIVRQTEQFRVRAASEELAKDKLANAGEQHPDVEWLDVDREAEEA